MLKKRKKTVALLMAAAIITSMCAGCGERNVSDGGEIEGKYGKGEITYPIETEGEELTVWTYSNPNVLKTCSDFNDTLYAQEIQKQTGIKVKFITPPVGDTGEAFNLLFSSNDLPDIICYNWKTFSGGGPDGAINSGYLFAFNDYLEDYAPNFYKTLKENPDFDKSAKSPEGNYYSFGTISHTVPVFGPIVRQDWLDELGLEKPETIEDWYNMLKAFKEKKGAEFPLTCMNSSFLYSEGIFESAYGTTDTFYRDGDTIKFGPLDDSYKEFVKEMTKWYSEGLIDRNIASTDGEAADAKILNDKTGATIGWLASTLARYNNSKAEGSTMNLEAAKYPVKNKGEEPAVYGKIQSLYADYAAISTTCKNKELAMRYLDYGFSEKGILTYTFGIEGESYVMEDGKPKYTDMVKNNPDGLSVSEALGLYCGSMKGGASWLTNDAYLQQLSSEREIKATETWKYNDEHCMPNLLMSSAEQKEYTDIMTEVETYIQETTIGVICGNLPISTLDGMNEQLKAMDIDRAIEIQQNAYNAYNN